MSKADRLELGPDHHLTAEELRHAAVDITCKINFTSRAYARVRHSRAAIEEMIAARKIVYGVTTGFGRFKDKIIAPKDVFDLQKNLIRSHSVGVGPLLSPELVRAALIVRLNSLAQGHSGVRPELLELAAALLNKNITPAVPSQGSVGSSGDLAPLSHIGLVLMGEGKAWYRGKLISGREALRRGGLKPIRFEAKEGLAWNNGTSVMTGIAAINLRKAEMLADIADLSCALTVEALCGVTSAYDARVHALRPHPGQILSAEHIRAHLKGSRLANTVPSRIQDAYSLRCAPQVHGAARDALTYVAGVIDRELNAVTDNPLIFTDPPEAISGGNFHGEPVAIAMDVLGIAVAELADVSERRTAKLVDATTNEGLPMFLIPTDKAGLHSGLMMTQYTAAALVSENKVLAHPASVDSIPTSANQEDHVSMGTIAARKGCNIVANTENVIAIELMTAAQAVEFRGPAKLGKGTKVAYQQIRRVVPKLDGDRELAGDISQIVNILPLLARQTG